MDNNENVFDFDEIKSLLEDANQYFENLKEEQNSILDKLRKMVNSLYIQAEKMFSLKDQIFIDPKSHTESVSYAKTGRNANIEEDQKIFIKLLTQFLFSLRTYLLNETITIKLGGFVEQDNLAEVNISQDQWLQKNLMIDLAENAVQLTAQITATQEMKDEQRQLLNMWEQVKEWGDWRNVYEKGDKTNEDRWYQKKEVDTAVWIRFSRNKRGDRFATPYYAHLTNQKGIYYNLGWLYEWFQQLIYDYDLGTSQKLFNSNQRHPLSILFSRYTKDNIESLQGGDVGRFQVKYYQQNKIQLLSFSQIFKYLIKIQQDLNEINSLNYDAAIEKLKNEFTNKNLKKINNFVLKKNNKLLDEYFSKYQS